MISWLEGVVKTVHENVVNIQLQGVGFDVFIPSSYTFFIEQKIGLHIYFHWNQEQGPSLFGFLTPQERVLFLLITSCQGIGPKNALSILSQISISDFVQAIVMHKPEILTTLNGIGKKKAEQIVLHLKDKIGKHLLEKNLVSDDSNLIKWKEISDALISLNYSKQEINDALAFVKKDMDGNDQFDQILRKALAFLVKKR